MQFLMPVILIVISGGLFFTWVDPQYQLIKEKQAEKAKFDATLEKASQIREFRDDVQKKFNAIDDQSLERLKKMLPTHIDNIRLILDINSVASKRGMDIADIKIDLDSNSAGVDEIDVTDQGKYGTVGFRFTVVTTYENFKSFIDDLALSLRIVDTTSIEIQTIEGEDDFYRFNVGIKTYWLPTE